MKFSRYLAVVAMLLLATVGVFGQSSQTGALTGTVTTDGAPLPGATVTVTSPQLQGSRTAISDANGNYNIGSLPPGDYTVRVELSGLQTVTRSTRVTLGGTARVDANLSVSAVTESITVTASAPAVMETTEVQTNYQKETIDNLPVGRTVDAIALLAPGTTSNGPRGAIQISGSFASDNLIVVNGANVQENLRGQSRPLFIEDAIQETTVSTGAISAEYGRFTGGVISSITKSGGNEFSGSIRSNLTDPSWTESSEFGEAKPDSKLNTTWEGTLGGRIIRDRLWFFTAGRLSEVAGNSGNLRLSGDLIPSTSENKRYEVKLTGQVTSNHSLMVNYLDNPFISTNNNQLGAYELKALDPEIEQAEDFLAARYSGIFSSNLLGEVNYSQRNFTFVGFGGTNRDPYLGTPFAQVAGGQGAANAPYFCGVCTDEMRNNELITAKLTYFLGTSNLGTHNIVGGVERFTEYREANNNQSPTDLTIWAYSVPARLENGVPIFTFTEFDTVEYFPVMIQSVGSDLTTDSLFLNDKWDLNANFSFNIGGRYDATEGTDQQGNPAADESSFSPRLGATYDIFGNGRFKANASYSKYVGRLAETVAGTGSAAGDPWFIYYEYDGEDIVGTSDQVVRGVLDWFFARGGTDFANWTGTYAPGVSIGGVSERLAGSLAAPSVDEWSIGGGFQISPTAYVRADYITREWNDYYGSFTNTSTGQVTEPITGVVSDLTLVDNTDLLTREYQAVQLAANTQFFNRLNIGANYTWSELTGNAEGEGTAGGPQSEGGWVLQYPEFNGFAQNRPTGFLSGDQTHKLRAWAAMDFALGPAGVLNVSVLQRFDSGTPFSETFTAIARRDPASGTNDLGYARPPSTATYFVSERGANRWDDVTATDIALNYRLPIGPVQFFAEGEVINAMNEQAQIAGVTTISRIAGAPAFNPFTEVPVEGVHYRKSATYGNPTGASSFQTPRTYRVSLGLRF